MTAKKETVKPEELEKAINEITPKNYFEILNKVDCSGKVEKKNGLSYLSWAWAWAEFCKHCPSATYEVVTFDGLPYVFNEKTGYMVYTRVTAFDITRGMWLPVMDSANFAMLDRPYEVQTKYKKITVQAATMFDINKAIMRCLTKNLAMFGLGLYIYAGEDLPEVEKCEAAKPETAPTPAPTPEPAKPETAKKPNKVRGDFVEYCKENDIKGEEFNVICKMFKLNNTAPDDNFVKALDYCQDIVKKRLYAQNLAEELGDYPEEV